MVGRVPASIEQTHLRQPETIGDGGYKEVFREGCKIPIQDSVVRYPTKNPLKTLDLRGGEFLGSRGLPASSGDSRTLAETLSYRKSRIFDVDSSACPAISRGKGLSLLKTELG